MNVRLLWLSALFLALSCAPTESPPPKVVHGTVHQTAYVPVNVASQVTGTLPIGNGGTGQASLGTGLLHSNGSAISSSAVDLATADVTGVLPTSNGGAGAIFFSYAEAAAQRPGTGSSGSFTVGCRFFLARNYTITGVKWYAPFAATYKVSVWNTAGTRMTSDNVVVGSASAQTTTFSSSQSLTANYNAAYSISTWDISGSFYMNETGASNLMPALNANVQWGPAIRWAGFYYASGDAFPTNGAGAEIYAMDPILQ